MINLIYNENIAIGEAIKFAKEFNKIFVVMNRNNNRYQIMLLDNVKFEEQIQIIFVTT